MNQYKKPTLVLEVAAGMGFNLLYRSIIGASSSSDYPLIVYMRSCRPQIVANDKKTLY